MRSFVYRFLAILLGFIILIFALNWTLDPFGYNASEVVDYDRRNISYERARNAYKIGRFHQWEGYSVLFGDSTTNMLVSESVAPEKVGDVFNFGVGGQTLFDTMDAVRYALDQKTISRVYIGVPFRHYDDYSTARVFNQNADAMRSPFRANLALNSTTASIAALAHLSGIARNVRRDPNAVASKNEMRNRLIGIRNKYAARTDPVKLRKAFEALICELRDQGQDYVLFAPPTGPASYAAALEYPDAFESYKNWVAGLGTFYDYDTGAGFAADPANFFDHNHLKPHAGRIVLEDLLSPAPTLALVTRKEPQC